MLFKNSLKVDFQQYNCLLICFYRHLFCDCFMNLTAVNKHYVGSKITFSLFNKKSYFYQQFFSDGKTAFISAFVNCYDAFLDCVNHFSAYSMGLFQCFWLSGSQKKCGLFKLYFGQNWSYFRQYI